MSTHLLRAALCTWALWAMVPGALAQKRNANVLFGPNWLVFGDPQQLPLSDSINEAVGACASLSDTSGQLKVYVGLDLISTVQWKVYDSEHNPLPGTPPELKLGQASWPRAVFIPKPGSPDSAYLAYIDNYTTSPPHMFRLGVVSVNVGAQGEPAGGVNPAIHFLSTDVAACFMAVPHGNGQDYWIVVQPTGTNAFHAHRVSAAGIDPEPVVSASGPLRAVDWQHGQWVPNTAGDLFALSQRRSTGSNPQSDTLALELFAFDISTGMANHLMTLPSKRSQGVEFSASGRYLYAMENKRLWPGGEVKLVQYDLAAAEVPASRTVLHTYVPNGMYGSMYIQLLRAIDGRIYCSYEGDPPLLGIIMEPDEPAPFCGYTHQGFSCTTDQAAGFFPPMKRYHDPPAIITAASDASDTTGALVMPQPLSGAGWLTHGSFQGRVQLRWLDAMGRAVRTEMVQFDNGRAAIDAGSLAPGSYLLKFENRSSGTVQTARVIIAR